MHGIHQSDSLANAAFADAAFDLICDPDQFTPLRGLKPKFLSIRFHGGKGSSFYIEAKKTGAFISSLTSLRF